MAKGCILYPAKQASWMFLNIKQVPGLLVLKYNHYQSGNWASNPYFTTSCFVSFPFLCQLHCPYYADWTLITSTVLPYLGIVTRKCFAFHTVPLNTSLPNESSTDLLLLVTAGGCRSTSLAEILFDLPLQIRIVLRYLAISIILYGAEQSIYHTLLSLSCFSVHYNGQKDKAYRTFILCYRKFDLSTNCSGEIDYQPAATTGDSCSSDIKNIVC